MVQFCTSCGTANTPDARFCAKCGTAMKIPAPDQQPPVDAQPVPIEEAAPLPTLNEGADYTPEYDPPVGIIDDPKPPRNWLLPVAVVATLLVIGALYFWLFVADDMTTSSGSSYGNSIEAGETTEPKQMFAMTEANIRDKPTTVGSNILGKLPRGSAVSGVVKLGEDGTSEWLELTDGKGFVGVVNLSDTEPPEIAKALNNKIWIADTAVDIWRVADSTDALLDRVSAGTKLTLVGVTANDFIEVKLPKGGVGYLADGAAILARLGGKPVAIAFNPQTCNFGGELGAEFARIGTRLRAQWQQLEDKEFVDDEARNKAYAAAEGKSVYVKLPRSFEGLSMTAIAQHYEAQSLYFADPPAKVIEVFRTKGFRIGNDGTFPSTELYAGITATRGEGAAYGKSELGCGV
jgi:zinc-ribbon domain